MSLNKGQQLAVERATQLYHYGTGVDRLMGLIAPGGYGKSYCMSGMIQALSINLDQVLVTAPTHESVDSLSASNKDYNLPEAITIYSALKMRINSNKEEEYLTNAKPFDFTYIKVLVIDEISFLGQKVVDRLRLAMSLYPKLFIIAVGDPDQTLTVNYGLSPIFKEILPRNTCYLTENMRQSSIITPSHPSYKKPSEKEINKAVPSIFLDEIKTKRSTVHRGSAVDLVVKEVKDCIKDRYKVKLSFESEFGTEGSLLVVPPKIFLKSFLDCIKKDKGTRMICWTNRACRRYNNLAREVTYGKKLANSQPFQENELIIAGNELIEFQSLSIIARKRQVGSVLAIDKVKVIPHITSDFGVNISGYRLKLQFKSSGYVYIPDEEGYEVYHSQCKSLADKALIDNSGYLWANYWNFKKCIADLRQSWAITAHGAQGKTLGNDVFFDLIDMNKNPNWLERLTLTNVALSRTIKNTWINQRSTTLRLSSN